ncbi:microtubule organization protein AKNA isoform X2 [Rana temporaria]|uniref:microtubule organization protein AKNA isoform X2 n=1 Tax=Rana temporaria TaxID=8407 RepID=UPI001AAD20B3|nr:microtubule organization protein AKNA isoform X2 [Rana temporaria]
MDSYNMQEQIGSSEDEDQNFGSSMDENGAIGLEERRQELDNREEGEEDEQKQMLGMDMDVGGMLGQDEDGILFPESPSEDRSAGRSWEEKFHFSQMPEERRNQDFIGIHDTDGLSFGDQPSRSMTLPSALGRRPPSRDQQLDMTEDEVDQGSSLGAWDGEEDENWNAQHYNGTEHEKLEDFDQTSAGEDQWDNSPGSPSEDYSNIPGNQGDESDINDLISPSPAPLRSTWNTRLLGVLGLAPGIEDETLPESSHTDSGEGSSAIPPGDRRKMSRVTQVSNQTKSTLSPSFTKMQNAQNSNEKKSKNAILAQYGRGKLNYPLPDLSKVGPRVRFPRDEPGYRPPQPHRPKNQSQSAPVLFKSPADIVREVLLSSVEMPVQEPAIPPTVPQEFKTPQQATQLVHQLQEDYHKLLTKYAEAENTIDRLRLEAKVHLYSDPAQPSHSVQMGTVMQGSKVMEFTISHAQAATFSSVNEDNAISKNDTGSSAPLNQSASPSDATLPGTSGSSLLQGPEDSASILRSHLETLHREVDLFEGLLQGGNLNPEEQQQAVRELRGSLDVLERRYLQAQEQYRQEQRRTGRPFQELDPQRELAESIFQLGVQLDEVQERVDHSTLSNPSTDLTRTTHHLDNAPLPSAVVPIPTTQTPYPRVTSPGPPGPSGNAMDTSYKEDPEECLPQPVRFKHTQLERDYGTLLSTYSSFKSLPDALGLEQDEWPQQLPQIAKPHDLQDGNPGQQQFQISRAQDHAQARRPSGLMTPVSNQSHHAHAQAVNLQPKAKRQSPRSRQQRHSRSITPQSFPLAGSFTEDGHANSPTGGTNVPVTPSPTEQRRASSVSSTHGIVPDEETSSSSRRMSYGSKTFPQRVSQSSPLPQLKEQSPRTPTTEFSVSEESIQESPSHKSMKNVIPSTHKVSPRTPKESMAQRRILSPETDSGFLGSESGRSFPLQKQRHRLSLNREDHPVTTHDSSNAAVKNVRRRSKNGSSNFSGTHKVLRDHREKNNSWMGPSEASSPSLGPKSLTDSESREESHTDESDSEQERSSKVIGKVSSGASLLPSPTDEPSQPLQNIMESRIARDEAIHNLQKEVTQIRHHLENSLNRSPARGKMGKPAIVQKQHDEEGLHFSPGLETPIYGQRAPVNDSREGTRYRFLNPAPIDMTEHVSVPHCQRCQEPERKKHVTMKTSKEEEESVPPTHPACPLCKGNNGSDNTPRTEMTNGEHRRHRRHQHCQHWYMGPPPPVSYIPSPLVPYSPPVIYSTPPGIYVPAGYNVADVRSSFSRTPSPSPDILVLDDLSRALESAKEMKITSKRMCRSLTMDLSMKQGLHGSCLF